MRRHRNRNAGLVKRISLAVGVRKYRACLCTWPLEYVANRRVLLGCSAHAALAGVAVVDVVPLVWFMRAGMCQQHVVFELRGQRKIGQKTQLQRLQLRMRPLGAFVLHTANLLGGWSVTSSLLGTQSAPQDTSGRSTRSRTCAGIAAVAHQIADERILLRTVGTCMFQTGIEGLQVAVQIGEQCISCGDVVITSPIMTAYTAASLAFPGGLLVLYASSIIRSERPHSLAGRETVLRRHRPLRAARPCRAPPLQRAPSAVHSRARSSFTERIPGALPAARMRRIASSIAARTSGDWAVPETPCWPTGRRGQ